jgi:hypothetical protein
MPQTYDNIATLNGTGSSNTITFSSISTSAYTDLILIINATTTTASAGSVTTRVGTSGTIDTGSNYSGNTQYGNGSTTAVSSVTNATAMPLSSINWASTTSPFQAEVHYMSYRNTSWFKTILVKSGNEGTGTGLMVNTWRNLNTINTLSIIHSASNWSTTSTFSLYGITAA